MTHTPDDRRRQLQALRGGREQHDPRSEAMWPMTLGICDAVDHMWTEQPDPILIARLLQEGECALLIRAEGRLIHVDAIKRPEVIEPPDAAPIGNYM